MLSQIKGNWNQAIRGFVGGFIGILSLQILTLYSGLPWLMAPFGATCVLLFSAPTSPLAQPRNVVAGHFISALIALILMHLLPVSLLSIACAVALSIALMQLLGVLHAPAGANPLVLMSAGVDDFSFLLTPVLSGSLLLVFLALLINNTGKVKRWPLYW